jgi:hypothetical protein
LFIDIQGAIFFTLFSMGKNLSQKWYATIASLMSRGLPNLLLDTGAWYYTYTALQVILSISICFTQNSGDFLRHFGKKHRIN